MSPDPPAPSRDRFADLRPWKRKAAGSPPGSAEADEELLQVVIETPRGSRHKYTWDEDDAVFRLKAEMPPGVVWPYDFGFVPGTVGGDGDALDVLLLMEEPAFPGCVCLARPLGVLETEQAVRGGGTERNDRLLAVAETSQLYAAFRELTDVPQAVLDGIEAFFAFYKQRQGKASRALGWKGAAEARALIAEATK